MARESLVDVVVTDLLDAITDGRPAPGQMLPPEAGIAERLGVSRLTVREALRVLQTQDVVRVVHGRGTVVRPVQEWTAIDAVVRASSGAAGSADPSVQLIELRRMIEAGAAELAAPRRTSTHLADLARHLEAMVEAHEGDDVEGFVTADMAFHDVVLAASGNTYIKVLLDPLSRTLQARRRETSAHRPVQEHAIERHRVILKALTTGDPAAARAAMEAHMDQTADDLHRYVLGGDTPS